MMNEHAVKNNGATVSFKSATATAAGPNLCGRVERHLGTLTGRVNLQTKTNKRHNGRNKECCLCNLTDCMIFPNVPPLLSCLRNAVTCPCSTILAVKRCLALKCSEPRVRVPTDMLVTQPRFLKRNEPVSPYVISLRLLQNVSALMFIASFCLTPEQVLPAEMPGKNTCLVKTAGRSKANTF